MLYYRTEKTALFSGYFCKPENRTEYFASMVFEDQPERLKKSIKRELVNCLIRRDEVLKFFLDILGKM